MRRGWLVYNGSDSMSLDDRPDEKGNTGWRYEESFGCEKMADLVHRKPDGWQTADPEQKEADIVSCHRSRAVRHAVRNILVGGPDRADHEGNTFTSDPRLNTIPDTRHSCPVEHGPQRTPDAERRPANDGKRDMVCCADASSHTDEGSRYNVADPYAEP